MLNINLKFHLNIEKLFFFLYILLFTNYKEPISYFLIYIFIS